MSTITSRLVASIRLNGDDSAVMIQFRPAPILSPSSLPKQRYVSLGCIRSTSRQNVDAGATGVGMAVGIGLAVGTSTVVWAALPCGVPGLFAGAVEGSGARVKTIDMEKMTIDALATSGNTFGAGGTCSSFSSFSSLSSFLWDSW